MKVAVGYLLVALLAASSGSAADDKPPATAAADKADDGANTTAVADKISAYSASSVSHSGSGDVSGHNDLGRALFASAVVFSGLALAAAFVWLVTPLFGYKFCAIVGNCDDNDDGGGGGSGTGTVGNGEDSVIVNGGEEASSLFPFSVGYRYDNAPYAGYGKRSLNYVGPILKTLSSAYDQFEEFSSTTSKTA